MTNEELDHKIGVIFLFLCIFAYFIDYYVWKPTEKNLANTLAYYKNIEKKTREKLVKCDDENWHKYYRRVVSERGFMASGTIIFLTKSGKIIDTYFTDINELKLKYNPESESHMLTMDDKTYFPDDNTTEITISKLKYINDFEPNPRFGIK